MGIGTLSLRVKRPGREAHHSPPSSAEVKECAPKYVSIAWCSVKEKARDNFTFYIYGEVTFINIQMNKILSHFGTQIRVL
jgi:hypothetical protein